MESKEFHGVRVSGIACAVPGRSVSTDSYVGYYGEKTVNRFKEATGIESRYLTDGRQTASDLAFVAARELMKKKGLTGADFDAVIMITQTPDYAIPATAFVLHKRLGIKKDCLVFDMNLGCSGYVNGLYLLAGLIESGTVERGLLLVGDSHTDRQVSDNTSFTMMFGDAASATVVERGEGTIRGMIRSDGEGFKALISPVPGARFPDAASLDGEKRESRMDGEQIFLFTITQVPRLFAEFFERFHTGVEDYDAIVLHQANRMILRQIAKKLKASPEQVPVSLDRYGNTDGASIPVTVVDVCEKDNRGGTLRLLTSGFGIGLSWGVLSFDVRCDDVLPMIFTDEYDEDGRNV